MYICNKCEKSIKAQVATYEDKYYHPDCLVCFECSQSLSGKQFVKEKNGTLVCVECNMKTAPKCKKCQHVFAPGVSYKKLGDGVYYHKECFTCVGPCHGPIGADFYELEIDKFLCTECYDKYGNDWEKHVDNNNNLPTNKMANLNLNDKPSAESLPAVQRERETAKQPAPPATPTQKPSRFDSNKQQPVSDQPKVQPQQPKSPSPAQEEKLCAKCNQKLFGTVTTYNNRNYHTKCFVCCQCDQDFKENSFFKLNGNPLCRTCHSKNLLETSSKCRKCSQPILDTVVTFKNGEYHDFCLVCTSCSKKLVGQSIYTDKQDAPFCVECFTAKEGKYCAKCTKLIAPNQSNLVYDSKHFHKECFTCQTCKRVINASESFYKGDDSDDSIICGECIEK
jgi:hypothetical protein